MSRTNLYGRSQCILGDTTTHGGVIITGSEYCSWRHIPIARKTDKVFCPKCPPHIFDITEGEERSKDRDLFMAAEGHMTACGATLIAQPAEKSALAIANAFQNGVAYDEQFVLKDDEGNFLANVPYTIKLPDGDLKYGVTNDNGETDRIFTEKESLIELRFGHYSEWD